MVLCCDLTRKFNCKYLTFVIVQFDKTNNNKGWSFEKINIVFLIEFNNQNNYYL